MADFYQEKRDAEWLADITHDMIQAGNRVTEKWLEYYDDGVRQIFNDQKTAAGSEDEDVQINQAFPAYMQEKAIQAQRRAMIQVEPHDPEQMDEVAAELWEGILQHQYMRDLDMPAINKAASADAFTFGMYVGKVLWDPRAKWDEKARKWIASPCVNLLYPPYFGADPEAEKIDQSTSYVYSGRRVAVDWVLQRWGTTPELKEAILKEAENDPYNSVFNREGQGITRPSFRPNATSESEMSGPLQRDDGSDLNTKSNRGRLANLIQGARGAAQNQDVRDYGGAPKHLTLLEVYFRDMSEQEKQDVADILPEELEANGSIYLDEEDQTYKVGNPEAFKKSGPHLKEGDTIAEAYWPARTDRSSEPKFPKGRFVIKLGRDTILNPKEEDQVYHYSRFPYVTGVHHELPHMWQGLNGTEMSQSPQRYINSTFATLLNNAKFHGNPPTIVEENAVADGKPVSKTPGAIITMAPTKLNAIRTLEVGNLGGGDLLALATTLQRDEQSQSGKTDQSIGRASSGKTTATEIAAKENADAVRNILQIQNKDEWIRQIMELVAEMDKENFEPGDYVRILEKGKLKGIEELTSELLDMAFSVSLEIGTDLPIDKQRAKLDATELANTLGPYPMARQLLKAFEIPPKETEEILDRMDGFREYEAFMEQQAEEAAEQEKQAEQEQPEQEQPEQEIEQGQAAVV